MRSAICWELALPVGPGFARNHAGWSYFCPTPDCLRPVHGRRRINEYFASNDRPHDPACPHYKPPTTAAPVPQPPPPVSREQVPTQIPNLLGQPADVVNRGRPAPDALRALAMTLRDAPPVVPGSLSDIVAAFHGMSPQDRAAAALTIEGHRSTYAGAFRNLGIKNPVDAAAITQPGAILYCGGQANLSDGIWWIKSRKTFQYEDKRLPLRFRIRADDDAAGFLARRGSDRYAVTLYWRKLAEPRVTPKSLLGELFETVTAGVVILAESPC